MLEKNLGCLFILFNKLHNCKIVKPMFIENDLHWLSFHIQTVYLNEDIIFFSNTCPTATSLKFS